MRREIDGKETVAHLFESTTQLSLDVDSGRPRLVVPAPEQDRDADNLCAARRFARLTSQLPDAARCAHQAAQQ